MNLPDEKIYEHINFVGESQVSDKFILLVIFNITTTTTIII